MNSKTKWDFAHCAEVNLTMSIDTMKHLTGKKVTIYCNSGKGFSGLITAASDDVIKIMPENKKDELVIFTKNIFAYVIIGEGASGGYSGLKVYICKNDDINCKGRVKLSVEETTIQDMGCAVCTSKTAAGVGYNCDFGCVGALEVLPSKLQRLLLNNMIVAKNEVTKNDGCGKVTRTNTESE